MRILIDCDGVLADYCQACFNLIRYVTNNVHTIDQVTHWDLFDVLGYGNIKDAFRSGQEEAGWCEYIPVKPGAQHAVKQLELVHEVVVVTSPMTAPTWTYERTMWLKDHFNIPKERIVHTAGKHYIEGDVLIDDSVDHCRDWKLAHPAGLSIVWDAPYNQNTNDHAVGLVRARSWDEVEKYVINHEIGKRRLLGKAGF